MTNEEWNKLHGYDEHGSPNQRFVWEGIGKGPPMQGGRYKCAWLVDRSPATGGASLIYKISNRGHMWTGSPVSTSPEDGVDMESPATESYEDAIKKAYARCMLRM